VITFFSELDLTGPLVGPLQSNRCLGKIEGITGDSLGAVCELAEVTVLFAVAILVRGW